MPYEKDCLRNTQDMFVLDIKINIFIYFHKWKFSYKRAYFTVFVVFAKKSRIQLYL